MNTQPALAIIVPARDAALTLPRCLAALRQAMTVPCELMVVDDGSSDDTSEVARQYGAVVLRHPHALGPAGARNAGVAATTAPTVVFVDADVAVTPDAIQRVHDAFADAPSLSAVFGSYDAMPTAGTLVSDYRNLLHHYVHQQARPIAVTFWAGLGAIRRDALVACGGFDKAYVRPSIEDIELGLRLTDAGGLIRVDRDLTGTHLKRWTFLSMVRTDVYDRALPWARLLLRRGQVPSDLNLRWRDRISAACVWLAGACAASAVIAPSVAVAATGAAVSVAAVAVLNRDFYRLLARKRGWVFVAGAFWLHALYFMYASGAFAWCWLEHMAGRVRGRARRAGTSSA